MSLPKHFHIHTGATGGSTGSSTALKHGGYTQWSLWGVCSKSCGTGTKSRTRSCTNPTPVNGGKTCVQQNLGAATENLNCNTNICPGNRSIMVTSLNHIITRSLFDMSSY